MATQAEVTRRVREVLDHEPTMSVERVGRLLSVCGDRPPRRQLLKGYEQAKGSTTTLTGVQYGIYRKGQKIHLANRPERTSVNGVVIGERHDSDSLCGRECEGLSTVWYSLEVLREVGWDNDRHICKRCLGELSTFQRTVFGL